MKKRTISTLAAAGMLAAMLSGAAAAQVGGEVALTFSLNPTCDFGQGSSLAPCELTEETITVGYTNPQSVSGAFDGIQVLDGMYVGNLVDGTFETSGTAYFAGTVEGCGAGTVMFDYAGSGTVNEDGSNTFDSDVYTVVPGGTLALTGSYAQAAVETDNGDGSSTAPYTGTFTCEAA